MRSFGLLRLGAQPLQAGRFPFLVVPLGDHAAHLALLEAVPTALQVATLLQRILEVPKHAPAGGQGVAQLLPVEAVRYRGHESLHEVEPVGGLPAGRRDVLVVPLQPLSGHHLAGEAVDEGARALVFHREDYLVVHLRRQLEAHHSEGTGPARGSDKLGSVGMPWWTGSRVMLTVRVTLALTRPTSPTTAPLYYAHSTASADRADWHRLSLHLMDTAARAAASLESTAVRK